ncbi:MAG: ankyrin repeat domain-containing protein, partial [Rhodocyclaceae bacterium]|nr:ankyrin repeat domain-containing protein [Rhodocyclaceae bacterium]
MKTTFRALIVGFTLAASSATVLAGAYDDLIAAVYRDDTDTVINLVNRGMDVNSVDPAGNTLLHVAARNGNVRLLEILLKGKANPNARNRVGDSPLMLAAYNGKLPAMDFLLTAGAELNHTGWTPLHYAVFAEQAEMVSYLLRKG